MHFAVSLWISDPSSLGEREFWLYFSMLTGFGVCSPFGDTLCFSKFCCRVSRDLLILIFVGSYGIWVSILPARYFEILWAALIDTLATALFSWSVAYLSLVLRGWLSTGHGWNPSDG